MIEYFPEPVGVNQAFFIIINSDYTIFILFLVNLRPQLFYKKHEVITI